MILEILLAICIGVTFGIITGLIPGIHVNLISILLLSFSPFLLSYTSPFVLAVFIISLALTHTFLDSIPSIFLGAPDPSMALSVLPGHKMLLEGKGYQAVMLTLFGSFSCLVATLILIPLSLSFLEQLYGLILPFMGYLLLLVVICMIAMEKGKKKFLGLYVFLQAGVLGMIVLNMPTLKQPLFPMLSGLFGTSTLLLSLGETTKLPFQRINIPITLKKKYSFKAVLAGVFSGSLTGIFPGLGGAQASIIGMSLVGRLNTEGLLFLLGGINTVNFAFSLGTFYALDKARNGAIVVVKDLISSFSFDSLVILLVVSFVVGSIALTLGSNIAKLFAKNISKINYTKLVYGIIAFIVLLVFLLTGFLGFLVLLVATFLGMIPALVNVKRSHNMGCLLLPVVLYFL